MTTRRSQLQEDTNYRVLRMLQDNPDLTQREIGTPVILCGGYGLGIGITPRAHAKQIHAT